MMNKNDFHMILQSAIAGSHKDLESILVMYEPLIAKYSYIDGKYDEDLYQYILIRIALNISKFSI